MNYYAVFKNNKGVEDSVLIADGSLFVYGGGHYKPALDSLKAFVKDKKIVNSKGEPVNLDEMIKSITIKQKNAETFASLHEEMITVSRTLVFDAHHKVFFEYTRNQ